jgi:hypothetical protein
LTTKEKAGAELKKFGRGLKAAFESGKKQQTKRKKRKRAHNNENEMNDDANSNLGFVNLGTEGNWVNSLAVEKWLATPRSKTELIWDRCYNHNFLRFLPMFWEKIGFFSQKPML